MEEKKYDYVVTFTFVEPVNLDKYFVEVLEDTYGKENVTQIDQSTYGIACTTVIDMDTLIQLLYKAEGKGEKCKTGGKLSLMTAGEVHQQIISRSSILNSRLKRIK